MRLAAATWPEVEGYLKTKTSLLIPTGSVEQHGPIGLLGTDYMTAQAVSERVGDILKVYSAAPVCYGMASHHLAFPGTASVRPSIYQAYLCELVRSFYAHGFRRFYFVNGHGGNKHSINAVFQELKHEGCTGASFYLFNWWLLPEVEALAKELYGDREGHHGTPSEVSLTYYLEGIESRGGTFDCAPLKSPWPLTGAEFRKLSPTGLMSSDPSLARKDHGKLFLEAAASSIAEQIHRQPVSE
jgi:creatinine amidohydrolase